MQHVPISSKWTCYFLFSRGEWIGWLCIQGDTTAALTINKVIMTRNTHHHPLLATNHTDGAKTKYGLCALQSKSCCLQLVRSTVIYVEQHKRTEHPTQNKQHAYYTNIFLTAAVWIFPIVWSKLNGTNRLWNFDLQTWLKNFRWLLYDDDTNVEVTRQFSTTGLYGMYCTL